jgi:predicted Zn-dependent protease with MMP-like domain
VTPGAFSKVDRNPQVRGQARASLTGHDGAVFEMALEEFEDAVRDALDEIPDELAELMDNVVVLVEDDPPAGEDLLGLYEGTPLTERGSWWAAGSLPDRITIFRRPTLAICDTRDDVVDEVAVTVVHEIAHHFGIDDSRLHELGWD